MCLFCFVQPSIQNQSEDIVLFSGDGTCNIVF